jgi:CheY-like chemotaxis protein
MSSRTLVVIKREVELAAVRILIVEDEGIVALDLRNQLQAAGYSVVAIAKSGEAAVEQANLTDPDLIMMDIHLKGEMDGIEAASLIVGRLSIPVIFVSALANKDTMARVKVIKHAGYVVKPFSREKLQQAIDDALALGGQRVKTGEISL